MGKGYQTKNVRPHISGSHKTFKVSDALLFKSNLSSDPVPNPVVGVGGRYKESQSDQSIKYGKRERKNKKIS